MEKHYWSPYQDNILRFLRQQRNIKKWTDIARILSEQYKIKGKNGKICRERYQEKFDCSDQNQSWSFREEKILFGLHNQLGNKWAIISRKMPGKSDNCIKNHFYSRLRKGLKKMNKIAEQNFGKSFKEIKFTVLFKIIEATEDGYKNNLFCQIDTSKLCYQLKNRLIILSYNQDEQNDFQSETVNPIELYKNITSFSKTYKRKPKKFRRIPTKNNQNLIFQDNAQYDESFDSKQISINHIQRQNESLKVQVFQSIENQHNYCFNSFKQQCYKIDQIKNLKKRRESAQTVGMEQILVGSGILEEEPNLPMISLTKKRTSYFDMKSEQSQKQNFFLDQDDLLEKDFFLKGLMSMKRISRTDQMFFD